MSKDEPMHGLGDLAVALGGSEDSFTGQLLALVAKAQATPENYGPLRAAFPRVVRAWELWMATSPAPSADELLAKLNETIAADPMPVFPLKGKDALAPGTVDYYRRECNRHGLHEQAAQVELAFREMAAWQRRNPDLVKLPDHDHVPARELVEAQQTTTTGGPDAS